LIVRRLSQILNTTNDVKAPNGNWLSRRLITRDDKMGFSFSDTIIKAGTETPIWYKNHLEAVYCISGDGSIEDLTSGVIHKIEPGVIYALDNNEKHILRGGSEDMHLVCVFNPALRGDEIHDEDGSYPPSQD
jgi:L-ectoine synthase